MVIELQKGPKISLQKETSSGGNVFVVGIGWDSDESASCHPFELDASSYLIRIGGKILIDEYLVFFKNSKSIDGSIIYSGAMRNLYIEN